MYERPEIFEIGQASELTLGWTNREIVDGCDCTKNRFFNELPEADG